MKRPCRCGNAVDSIHHQSFDGRLHGMDFHAASVSDQQLKSADASTASSEAACGKILLWPSRSIDLLPRPASRRPRVLLQTSVERHSTTMGACAIARRMTESRMQGATP